MREVRPDDVVFHFTDNQAIVGISIVDAIADKSFIGLPDTEWADRTALRVPLIGYTPLNPSIHRDEFLGADKYRSRLQKLHSERRNLFFNAGLNLNQGAYLTQAPEELVQLWRQIYLNKTGGALPHVERKLLDGGELQNGSDPLANLADALLIESAYISRIWDLLKIKKQIIFYGPPGNR